MYSMIFGFRKPEPVRRTTFVGFMAVQGHVLLRKVDPFTQNRPYLSSIPLLWLGFKPLYFCTKKVLPPLWGGFFKAIGFSEPPIPLAAPDLYDRYRAIIFDFFDDPYYHRPGAPAPRARGSEEEDVMRTADDVVGTLMRAALGAWGGYILGRHWNLW